MKNLMNDIRKRKIALVGLGILIVLALILLINFIKNNVNSDKFKDDYEKIELRTDKYISSLTFGYITEYSGSEKLFENKKTTLKDLKDENIVIYSMMKILEDQINEEVDAEFLEKCSESVDSEFFEAVKAEDLKKTIKNNFGIDWQDKEIETSDDMFYDIKYLKDIEAYVLIPKNVEKIQEKITDNKSIGVAAVKSVSTSKELKTTIIVAYKRYVASEDDATTYIEYYKDKEQKDLVYKIDVNDIKFNEDNGDVIEEPEKEEMLKHKDSFDSYVVTYIHKDDNFTFKSIQKK